MKTFLLLFYFFCRILQAVIMASPLSFLLDLLNRLNRLNFSDLFTPSLIDPSLKCDKNSHIAK